MASKSSHSNRTRGEESQEGQKGVGSQGTRASGSGRSDQTPVQKAAKFSEETGTGWQRRDLFKLDRLQMRLQRPTDVQLNITLLSARTVYRSLKASASVLAVSERQALETLSRDEKTASRTLTQVRAKDEESQRNQERLRSDEQTQKASKYKLEESLLTSRATMRAQSKITKTSRVSGQGQVTNTCYTCGALSACNRPAAIRSKLLRFSPRTNALWPGRSDPPRDPSDSSATSPLPLNRSAMTAVVQAVISGHADAVRSVSFSPNGTCIASGPSDKTVRLWNAATGRLTLQGGHRSQTC